MAGNPVTFKAETLRGQQTKPGVEPVECIRATNRLGIEIR
jgi:hypothetical protein